MKGLHVYTRSYEHGGDLKDQNYAGLDRRLVLDAAVAGLPASTRASIAKQLGFVLEHGTRDACKAAEAADTATDSASWVWVKQIEVIS